MNTTKRSWLAMGAGLVTLVVLASCAETVTGEPRAAVAVSTSRSSSSSSSSESTSTKTSSTSTTTSTSPPTTSGGTRTNSTRTSSTETSSSPTSTSERDDPNVAPASNDLLWGYQAFGADWTATTDEPGIHEYTYKESQCFLGLYQPGGYQKRDTLPTDAEVTAEYVAYVGKKFTDPSFTTVDTTGRDFKTDINGVADGAVPATITLAGQHVTFASDGGEAQLYGYRNGDYSLVVALVCKGGEFPTYLPEMAPKLDDLAIGLYY